jgi:hypothetical protein
MYNTFWLPLESVVTQRRPLHLAIINRNYMAPSVMPLKTEEEFVYLLYEPLHHYVLQSLLSYCFQPLLINSRLPFLFVSSFP